MNTTGRKKVNLMQAPPSPRREKKVNPKPDNQFLNLKLDRAPELVLLLGSLSSFLRAQENEEGGLSERGMAFLNKYLSP